MPITIEMYYMNQKANIKQDMYAKFLRQLNEYAESGYLNHSIADCFETDQELNTLCLANSLPSCDKNSRMMVTFDNNKNCKWNTISHPCILRNNLPFRVFTLLD